MDHIWTVIQVKIYVLNFNWMIANTDVFLFLKKIYNKSEYEGLQFEPCPWVSLGAVSPWGLCQ